MIPVIQLSADVQYFFNVSASPQGNNSIQINYSSLGISDCNTAVELNTSVGAFQAAFSMYSANEPKPSCYTSDDRIGAEWFTFTATTDYQVLKIYSYATATYSLYTGGCNNLIENQCWETKQNLVTLTPGTTYHLNIISAERPSNSRYSFEYEFHGEIPAEDECDGALNLTLTENLVALPDDPNPTSYSEINCSSTNTDDWWVSFTAPPSGGVVFDGANSRTISILDNCLAVEPIFCRHHYRHVIENLVPGQTYFANIESKENSLLKYKALELPQTNGSCEDAITVTADDCTTAITGQPYGNPDGVWYQFAMPSTGHVKINGSDHNTYFGNCAELDPIYTQSYSAGNRSIIAAEGTIVYIEIYPNTIGYGSYQHFEFCIETLDPVTNTNQSCDQAIILSDIQESVCTAESINLNTLTRTGEIVDIYDRDELNLSLWYQMTSNSEKIGLSLNSISQLNLERFSITAYTSCPQSGTSTTLTQDGEEVIIEGLTIGESIFINIKTKIDPYGDCYELIESCGFGCTDNQYEEYYNCLDQIVENSHLSFDLCVRGLLPPAINDDCTNATSLSLSGSNCDQAINGNTIESYDTKYNCQIDSRELFYSFTNTEQLNTLIKIEESTIPMNISIFDGSCNGPEIACDVNSVILITQPNVEYIIAVSPLLGTQNSTFELCVTELVIEGGGENVGIGIDNPIQSLQVNGGIAIGSTDIPLPGTIRYTGFDFQGYTSEGWKSLSSNTTNTPTQNAAVLGDDLGSHQATRDINANSNRLINLPAPLSNNDAANKVYVDNQFLTLESQINGILQNPNTDTNSNSNTAGNGEADNLGNHTATQNLVMGANRISELATPLANNDAATKSYVDNVAQVLSEQINTIENSPNGNIGPPNNTGNSNGSIINPLGSSQGDNLGNHTADSQLVMSGNQIIELPAPVNSDHAANKEYVDTNIENIQNQIEELETSTEPSNFELINVNLSQEPLAKYLLNIETTENTHAVKMDFLYSGWSFERPTNGFPYIYNNERYVAIGDHDPKEQFHIYDNVPMRIGGENDYFNFAYSGTDLNFSAVTDDLVSQHFKLDYTVPNAQATSFDFDLRNRRLGVNKEDPTAYIHIDASNTDALKIERNGLVNTVIDRDGKLGIGIDDPTKEIDVDGQVQISTNSNGSVFQLNLIENNSGYSRLNFTNTSNKDITLAAIPSATTANSKLNFFIEDAGDVMTLTGADRVGINNGSPQSDLHVIHKNGPANGGLRLQNVNDTNADYWNMYVSSSTDELRLYANATQVGEFNFTSGAYSAISDERMKSGIQPLHFEWSKFMLLNAANYSFLHDASKRQYLGLLAQEVQEIYPELVQYDEAEDTYRLDYSGTGVIAIKAVQELKNENDVLKKKIEHLENKLEELIKLMK